MPYNIKLPLKPYVARNVDYCMWISCVKDSLKVFAQGELLFDEKGPLSFCFMHLKVAENQHRKIIQQRKGPKIGYNKRKRHKTDDGENTG